MDLTNGTHTNPTVLPGIEHMLSTTRPQTSDSSATTVPPSSNPNTEDSAVPIPDVQIATLLSALPTTIEARSSTKTHKHHEGSPEAHPEIDQTRAQGKTDRVNATLALESHVEESVRKQQKGKRRVPPRGRKPKPKPKGPRLGASQANMKKRGRAPTRRSRTVKGKKASAAKGAPDGGMKNAQNTQNAVNELKSCSTVNLGDIVIAEKVPDLQPSQSETDKVGEIDKCPSEPIEKPAECDARCMTVMLSSANVDIESSVKDDDAIQSNGKVTDRAEQSEKGKQTPSGTPSSRVDDAQQKEKDNETTRSPAEKVDKDSPGQDARASKGTDTGEKTCSDAQEEANLKEKYEDLSRRYLSLVRGLVQSGCAEKDDNKCDSDNEDDDSRVETAMVDRKLYDTIYLCKVAGMLGAMKIEEGPSKCVRGRSLRGVDAYKQVVADGFEFVEDLMKMGRPDENSTPSVKAVFRDVHIRLVKDIWERNQDKQGAKVLLLEMVTLIVDQVKEWYMKIMDGTMCVLWSEMIAIQLAEGVYKKVVKMDEEISGKVVGGLRDILKYVSEYYQECERDVEKASLEKFCYSCEVSICIARSVPDAALTLEEEVAYVIGRHNGVFSHCVSRLLAEREARVQSKKI